MITINCKLFYLSVHSSMEHHLCVRYHISLKKKYGVERDTQRGQTSTSHIKEYSVSYSDLLKSN